MTVLRENGKRAAKVVGHEEFKALVLDIETRPNLGYVWALWDQNIGLNQLVDVGQVICFAAKWLGEPDSKIVFYSDHHDGHAKMVKAAHRLIDEADAVIHYNGRAFDIKHLNREFLLQGLAPPSPHKDIDLLQVARSRFKFPSNKLDHVSQALGVGEKVKHEGFDLWTKCMAGDAAAWKRMRRYNVGDIKITEAVYLKLRPWIKTHPHVGMFTGDLDSCPKCGSTQLTRRGTVYTTVQAYQQFQCKTCGGYSRSARRTPDTATTTRNAI